MGQNLKKRKQGFAVPIRSWFQGELKEVAKQILDKLNHEEYFKVEKVRHLFNDPQKFRNSHKLWNLMVFDLWHKIYIDENKMSGEGLNLDSLL